MIMARLGVARALPWRNASPKNLLHEWGVFLGDDRFGREAALLHAKLTTEDGLGQAVLISILTPRLKPWGEVETL